MSTSVTIVRALPIYPNAVFLQWEVETTDTGPFSINIYRGGSPSDLTLLDTDEDIVNYTDSLTAESINLMSSRRDIYYQIGVVPTNPATEIFSAIANLDPEANTPRLKLARRKLRRDFGTTLRIGGVEVSILKQRHFGTVCTTCYDPISKMVVLSSCDSCYGTKWENGYYAPYLTRAQINNSPTQENMDAPEGKNEVRQTRLRLPDFPKVDKEDIIVSLKDNRRFEVVQVVQTEIQAAPIHQSVVVSLLSPSDIRYRLPADPRGGKLGTEQAAPTGLP